MPLPGDLSESDLKDWYDDDDSFVPDDEGVVFDTDFEDVDPFGSSFDTL